MSLFSRIMSYLGWCPSKKSAAEFLTPSRPNISSPILRLKRKLRLSIMVLVFITAFYPTVHYREIEPELVKTLDCNVTLEDGEYLEATWNWRNDCTFKTNLSSNEDVLVQLAYAHYLLSSGNLSRLYGDQEIKESHEPQPTLTLNRNDIRVNETATSITVHILNPACWNKIRVLNPAWRGDGSPAEMSGSIMVYRTTEGVWLPWWWAI